MVAFVILDNEKRLQYKNEPILEHFPVTPKGQIL